VSDVHADSAPAIFAKIMEHGMGNRERAGWTLQQARLKIASRFEDNFDGCPEAVVRSPLSTVYGNGAMPNSRSKLETLVAFLRRIGISRFGVDATAYGEEVNSSRERADSSARMRAAHEAAANDKRFREQVQESLNDPRPSVPNAQVQKIMDAKISALRKQLAEGGC